MKKEMDKIANEYGWDYAQNIGKYKEFDVWTFNMNTKGLAIGTPTYILQNDNKRLILSWGDKDYEDVMDWDFSRFSNEE